MAMKWIEFITGSLDQKKQYKQNVARIEALPEPYKAAAKGMHRYFLYQGGITDGDVLTQMFGDLVDLWERASLDGTPIREITGDDPIEFAEQFFLAYGGERWIDKERARFTQAIDDAAKEQES